MQIGLQNMGAVALFVASMGSHAQIYSPPSSYQVKAGSLVTSAAYDATTQTLLATVSSAAGPGLGNTVQQFNRSGNLVSTTFIGSEPDTIALSADGSTAYVGLGGASLVVPYNVNNATAGSPIVLGSSQYFGAYTAVSMAVSPSDNNTVAIISNGACCSGTPNTLLFSNGNALPNGISYYQADVGSIAYGANANTLYAYNNNDTGFGLFTLTANSTGLAIQSSTGGAFSGFNTTIQYQNGLIYGSNGQVYDPNLGADIGTYVSPNNSNIQSIAVDSADGLVYGLDSNGNLTIFDLKTYVPIANYVTGISVSNGAKLIDMGQGELAVIAGNVFDKSSGLYFLSAVPEPSTMVLYILGLAGLFALMRHSTLRK